MGIAPPGRVARVEALLDRLELGRGPLPYPADAVLEALAQDKKHARGRLRWVLPTAASVEVRQDVPDELVARVLAELLSASPAVVGG